MLKAVALEVRPMSSLVLAPLVLLVKLCEGARWNVERKYSLWEKASEIVDAWLAVCADVTSPPSGVLTASAIYHRAKSAAEEVRELEALLEEGPGVDRVNSLLEVARQRYAVEIVRHVLALEEEEAAEEASKTETPPPPSESDLDELEVAS